MGRLDGKIAVVFGGARGIGRAVVSAFAAEGAAVHVADLEPLEPGAEPAGSVSATRLDATDPQQVADFVQHAVTAAGRVDICVNNVGIHLPASVVEATPDDFDRIFTVNVKPAYLACHHLLPHMLARGAGSIVNVSSNGGLIGRPADPLYNASKHALIGLTKSLAVAYAQDGIRVNAVCPGSVETRMVRGDLTEAEYEQRVPQLVSSTPAARVARPSEVAAAVLFLASDESPAVTGAALPVDGAKSAGVLTADRYRFDIEVNRHFD